MVNFTSYIIGIADNNCILLTYTPSDGALWPRAPLPAEPGRLFLFPISNTEPREQNNLQGEAEGALGFVDFCNLLGGSNLNSYSLTPACVSFRPARVFDPRGT